jgi:hypothetical protein
MAYAGQTGANRLLGATAGSGERVYFTPERIATARRNIDEHEWAQDQLDRIMNAGPISSRQSVVADGYIGAAKLVQQSLDDIFRMMPPITVPRQDGGASVRLCPVHGEDIRRVSGHRPWNLDYENHPWKVICPVGGEMYPSNDFAAGEMTGGDYPDAGDGILVDGKRYPVIRYYAHMAYLHRVYPAIRALAAAYILTDDARYGVRCAVLLAALADNFPGPSFHSSHCFDGEYGPRSGMVTDYIWECITMPRLALAYDAVRPVYDGAPDLLAYLRSQGLPADSPEEARRFVEERIFRQAMKALQDGAISGNPGHHQLAAVTLALVLDDVDPAHRPNSLDMVEFTYYQGYAPAGYVFANFLTRDGGGFEGPGYDRIKFNYIEVAKRMELLRARHRDKIDPARYPPLLNEAKTRAMYEFYLDITLHDAFAPEVGDTGGARLKPGFIPPRFISIYPHFYADGFRIYRDPRYAAALLGLDNQMPSGADLFEPSLEAEARAAAAQPDARVEFRTRLLDHYGFAMLRDANSEILTNYTALKGHYQDDFLALYLYANQISLLPDLGYPFTWDYRWQWDANSTTHNTVTVDGAPPLTPPIVPRGWVSLVGSSETVQASIIAHDCYNPVFNHSPFKRGEQYAEKHPPVERYERATVLIDVGGGSSYAVDVFFVDGGMRHDQSWHSAMVEPTLPAGDWKAQSAGTAAGPDVAFGESYVNVRGREVTDGLCYVTDVQRMRVGRAVRFDWHFAKLAESAGLKLHVVPTGGPVELIYGKGRSPARPKEWRLPYLFVRREGDEGLSSRFVTVLEPYRGDASAGITGVRVEGDSVMVSRGDMEDTITIRAPKPVGTLMRGEPRDVSVEVTTSRGTVRFGDAVRGRIVDVDRTANCIMVDAAVVPEWVRIFSEGRSSVYRVLSSEPSGAGRTRLVLKETSLLGRARATGYADGVVRNGAPLPFATGSVRPDGQYIEGTCRYAGARAETPDGATSLRLRGVDGQKWITGISGYDLYFDPALKAAELEAAFGKGLIDIHDYGVGDRFEALR